MIWILFLRLSRRLYKQNIKKDPNLPNLTLLILLYPTDPHPSNSTPPVKLYPIHPTLTHASNLTSIAQFYPTRSTLTTTLYPILPTVHHPILKHGQKNTNEKKIRPLLSTTSSRYIDCSGDNNGDIHPSCSTPLIPFNNTRPTIPKPSNSIPSNIKREQNLQTWIKIRTPSSTTTSRYTDCSGDGDDDIVIYI